MKTRELGFMQFVDRPSWLSIDTCSRRFSSWILSSILFWILRFFYFLFFVGSLPIYWRVYPYLYPRKGSTRESLYLRGLGLVCLWDFYGRVRGFSSWIFGTICNPCDSVIWLKTSPFCPEDIGKLSNFVKSFVLSLLVFGSCFIVCNWLGIWKH